MAKSDLAATAEAVELLQAIDVEPISVAYREEFGLTPIAAEAICRQADATVKVAEATHAKPAIQETFRTAIVVVAVIAIDIIAACKLEGGLLAWVLGGSATGLAGYFVLDGVAKVRSKAKQAAAATLPASQ